MENWLDDFTVTQHKTFLRSLSSVEFITGWKKMFSIFNGRRVGNSTLKYFLCWIKKKLFHRSRNHHEHENERSTKMKNAFFQRIVQNIEKWESGGLLGWDQRSVEVFRVGNYYDVVGSNLIRMLKTSPCNLSEGFWVEATGIKYFM